MTAMMTEQNELDRALIRNYIIFILQSSVWLLIPNSPRARDTHSVYVSALNSQPMQSSLPACADAARRVFVVQSSEEEK